MVYGYESFLDLEINVEDNCYGEEMSRMNAKKLFSQINVYLLLLILVPSIPPTFHLILEQVKLANSVPVQLSQSQLRELEANKLLIIQDFEVRAEDLEISLAKSIDPYVYVRKGEKRGSIATAGLRNLYVGMDCIILFFAISVVFFSLHAKSKREQLIVNVGQTPLS